MKCWCGGETVDCFHPEYSQCVSCGTFVSNRVTEPGYYEFDSYWQKRGRPDYIPIDQRAKDDFDNRIPFWGGQLKAIPGCTSILEIGSCHGGFLYYCCKDLGFIRLVGIEISEGTCDFARKTFGVEMICGEFPNVEINEKFDLVCGFDVLEHFSKPLDAMRKMKSLGEYVMVQTPCYRGEEMAFPHFKSDEHLFIFNKKSIKLMFSVVGLSIISIVRGAFPWDITVIGEVLI